MSYAEDLRDWQYEYWLTLAVEHHFNVAAMAKASGVNRTDLHGRLVRLGVVKPSKHQGNWGELRA
jgi:transcriptional regulator of acetoin/glycerol metabolism